ncbi:hypothetical protein AMTRI_Chr02g217090 [Amborella trichopoda]
MARSDVEVCSILFFFFILHSVGAYYRHTVKRLILYFHNIIYDGTNAQKVTSTLVGAPQGANLTRLTGNNHFGDLVVFDDPITLHNNLHSSPVGRAQGMYLFSFVLNSTNYLGTLNFIGADPILQETHDISVVGGTDAYEGEVYFQLKVDKKFYKCY